jgi:signal transduction histidine kinase
MMKSYIESIATYLEMERPWLQWLARAQLIVAAFAATSLLSFLCGGEPFMLVEGPRGDVGLIAEMVRAMQPRYQVHPSYLVVCLTLTIADVIALLVCALRTPRTDLWVVSGIAVTGAAVAFEVTVFGLGVRWAVPVFFAANLIEVLRITYVSTWRSGAQAALLERELAEQRRRVAAHLELLEATAPLATLGALTSELGHEMRNPVASASLYLDAAIRRAEGGETVAEPLARARLAMDQLASLLGGLGRYSRVDRGHGLVSLRRAIDDAASLCAHRLDRSRAELSVDVPDGLKSRGSSTELTQLFVNLIANACDAIETQEARWIRVTATEHDGRVRARVSDAGPRPDDKIAAFMFDAPFTTKGIDRGTGLGLALCRRIVDALGGSIALDRKEPNTSILVELPAAHDEDVT